MINLSQNELLLIQSILRTFIPNHTVWLFGSRTTANIKPYSDVDLAIMTQQPLSTDVMAALSSAFAESDLPYKVDLVDWSTLDETFKTIIQNRHEIIQPL